METLKVRDPLVFKKSLDKVKTSIAEFGKIAKRLEDPNKDNPLSQLMERSISELNQELFTVGVMGTSETALLSLLKIYFPDTFSLPLLSEVGLDYLFLVKSETSAYQIRSKIGSVEYDSLSELFENLKNHPEKRTARVGIPWNQSIADQIQFVILPDVNRLLMSPALNSFITNLCYSLIISFSQKDDCTTFRNAVEQITTVFEFLFFYECMEEKPENKVIDEGKHIKKFFPSVKISKLPMFSYIYPGIIDSTPSLISREDNVLRSALFSKKKSQELISTLSLAGTDIEEQKKEFLEKKQSLSKLLASSSTKEKIDKIREGSQKIKNLSQQKFAEMEQSIREIQTNRVKMTKTDIYDDDKGETKIIDRIVKVSSVDLSLEKKDSKYLKVTFANRFLGDIKQFLIEEVNKWNQDDLEIIKKGINNLTDEIKNLSELHFESRDSLEIPTYNNNLTSNLKENEIIIKYQFLIPNYDNFLNIFSESRAAVMSVIMLGSALFGILAFISPSLKNYTGTTAMLGILSALGMAIYKIMNRETSKNERLMEEKEKIIDYLASEVLKIFTDSNRTMQDLLFRENKEWLGKLNRATEDVTKDVISKLESESIENRKMLEKRIVASEQKIKNAESMVREHQKTLQDLNRTFELIHQDFQKLLSGLL